jgi:tellurite resistance protein TerC
MLGLDLGLFHRKAHEVKIKKALVWSEVWIGLALLFNLGIYFWRGEVAALEFLTGYLLETSLNVDNVFVFLLIFSHFRVPALYQHKVLLWGILGALITRAVFAAAGIRGAVSRNYFLCFLPSSYSFRRPSWRPIWGKIGTT